MHENAGDCTGGADPPRTSIMKKMGLKARLIKEAGGYGAYMEKYNLPNPWMLPKQFRNPGRNKPCYCGSKKKFKKCCLLAK